MEDDAQAYAERAVADLGQLLKLIKDFRTTAQEDGATSSKKGKAPLTSNDMLEGFHSS